MEKAANTADAVRPSLPVALTVSEVVRENREMVTLFFPLPEAGDAAARGLDVAAFRPGHFAMLWIPRLDEKPYVLSYLDGERLGVTVQQRGPFSTRVCAMQPGERVGMRGPFGRPFWDVERHEGSTRVALFGGGCGMATIGLLAERLPRATVVQGARSADALLFTERFDGQVIFTDDGSAGRKGFPTAWLEEQAAAGAVDMVYGCGPEPMLAALVEISRRAGIGCQVSLERYMKCGFGVCGQCDCDGRLVCRDGPTFSAEELAGMPSFGRVKRDKTGRRRPLSEADQCAAGPVRPAGTPSDR